MDKKGEISARRAWLIALLALADDVVILVLVFIGLWLFHVEITWWVVLIIIVAVVAFAFIIHRAVVPAIRKRKINGAEGMIGMSGVVTVTLSPLGTVKIKGEYWKAKTIGGNIAAGEDVEVIGINGLNLEVRKKHP